MASARLAGGGEACSGIEHLRALPELFGDVAPGSTLVEVHSENEQGAAPHFKGGFGFHPMVCSTADGEPLRIKLRAGNAAANDIADHLEAIDAAVGVLPAADAAGHRSRAQVADLADLADLSGWPAGTRLVVRREPRHPGAQRGPFPSDSFRCWGFLTVRAGHPTRLDELMRRHADAEDAASSPEPKAPHPTTPALARPDNRTGSADRPAPAQTTPPAPNRTAHTANSSARPAKKTVSTTLMDNQDYSRSHAVVTTVVPSAKRSCGE